MANPSPLQSAYQQADALFMPYGTAATIVAQHEAVEIEYAAIRKHVGLLDCPHRGLVRLTGKDRVDLLHRMLTNDVRDIPAGGSKRAFLLDPRGRITADLLVAHFEEASIVDTDIHQAAGVATELEKLVFTEDVRIEDLSASFHRISLHGPKAERALEWWRSLPGRPAEACEFRYDEAGEIGVHVWMPTEAMTAVGERDAALLETFDLRPIGWLAYNIARIEAGEPLFNVDFGPGAQPHETGILDRTVSFNKGCYRGQEIVARIQSRSHPPRILVAWRGESALPVAGSEVFASDAPDAPTIGAITSSTPAPMLSQAPIGFAMLKWDHHAPGTTLHTPAEGATVPIIVQDKLRFYERTS